jgi:subfamily B ATP-binding cassette protein HlyB/CyaB
MMSQYRHAVWQILAASFFVQSFTLATPLLFQVVFDKVLVHNSLSTSVLVFVVMLLVALFDATLQYLKQHTLSFVGSRLDLDLSRRVFDHLFKLPLAYFERTPAGQISSRLREIDTIRRFVIGQGPASIIEAIFALIFLVVLAIYSLSLTAIVAGTIPLYLIMAAIIRPRMHSKSLELSERLAESQQLLVECIIGAHTLKSNAIEPLLQRQWDEKRTRYAAVSFETSVLDGHVMISLQTINSLTTALILLFGARAVIDGNMSIGTLIAFNMISTQAIRPIIRLCLLWGDFQQMQIAVNRLGDIMRSPVEPVPPLPASPPRMRGAISFRDISFRYAEHTPEVLKGISIDVGPGEVIGIVGASGSGKSTLAKLIQRLYLPQRGQILLDGFDITQLHPAWIRSQIRVVLQETLLFNRTIHENIALAAPYMTREHVTAVARLAGADEFISRLPQGYDTKLEERGMSLSGGQRQRIAIARALATNPRILILDEATSAVDYESERIVHNNMKEMIKGRTVIIIAHRLMTVRNCDRIIALAGGSIVEDGTHDELLRHDHGLYRYLWALQSGRES